MIGHGGTLEIRREQKGENRNPKRRETKKCELRERTKVTSTERKGAHLLYVLDLTLQLVNTLLMGRLVSRPPLQVHLQKGKQYSSVKETPVKIFRTGSLIHCGEQGKSLPPFWVATWWFRREDLQLHLLFHLPNPLPEIYSNEINLAKLVKLLHTPTHINSWKKDCKGNLHVFLCIPRLNLL